MRLIFIRHADPDYAKDSLTERGFIEAEALADRMCKVEAAAYYCSPLGRAQDTARPFLSRLGREAETLGWLREFWPDVIVPGKNLESHCAWDWIPEIWTRRDYFYDKNGWYNAPEFIEGDVKSAYDEVANGLDEILKKHGYERDGELYRAVAPNRDTIVFICHFGLISVMLSHLLGVSPMTLWHGTCALPSSVTILNTEERRDGVAYFRMCAFSDTSHLYAKGILPSFSARFCETYDSDERHD